MRFSSLVQFLKNKNIEFKTETGSVKALPDPEITDVFSDSRSVAPGAMFCCIRGEKSDGHEFISRVEEAGANALLCERQVTSALPCIIVPSVRKVMGYIASEVCGKPAEKLMMVGVTGTNGKTTTTYIIRSILEAAGIRTGLLGTIIESDGLNERDADRTTPESCVIQRNLALMLRNNCKACVMETSSHGLFIGRLQGCKFDIGVFTNLNPEHLDFHTNMENYFQAKRLLFSLYAKDEFVGAVNAEDSYTKRILEEFSPVTRGFSLNEPSFSRVTKSLSTVMGTSITIESKSLPILRLKSPLVGDFNIWNVLAAVTALRGRVDDEAIIKGVASIPQVPGRLERFELANGACCFIDFAHTPEALRNVLSVARKLCKGRLISVFGHGGGRYPLNRPAMGKIAAEYADKVIVTVDNSRDEEPGDIADAIVKGIESKGGAEYQVILDRREAVLTALSIADNNDVVVVSGKGPEKYIIVKDKKIPYNDAETVKSYSNISS